MGRLEHDTSLFNLTTEAKHWQRCWQNGEIGPVSQTNQASRKAATEPCMKRWLVMGKEQVAETLTLEVQTAQQLRMSLNPRARGAGGGGRGATLEEA